MVKIPSYKVFAIYADKNQSASIAVNKDKLQERIDYLLSNKLVHKVVVEKGWF